MWRSWLAYAQRVIIVPGLLAVAQAQHTLRPLVYLLIDRRTRRLRHPPSRRRMPGT